MIFIIETDVYDVSAGPSPAGDNVWGFSLTGNGFIPPALPLRLTDRYGNSGCASLTLDAVDGFDAPRVL
ncbi:hypothetical protein [Sodalis sp. C49]|uniref:hypothetical protein n=1 Tax=Sodalis sp. C49 TaxID=3228929 RepID=UPI0039658F2D